MKFWNYKSMLIAIVLLALLLLGSTLAQNVLPEGTARPEPLATVRFGFDHPGANPAKYQIIVESSGDSEYVSGDPLAADADSQKNEIFRRKFRLSDATRDRIFTLTRTLGFFKGDFEFKKHKIAFSGQKTLTYTSGTLENQTVFNWSENKDILELATLFQGISATLEVEPRLKYLKRFDKLGLNAELASLEKQANNGWLKEIALIREVLHEITNDRSVMGMARNRAERLLKLAEDSQPAGIDKN